MKASGTHLNEATVMFEGQGLKIILDFTADVFGRWGLPNPMNFECP